jgi:hypothetical protein
MRVKNQERDNTTKGEKKSEVTKLNASMIDKFASIVNKNEPVCDLWPQSLDANNDYRVARYKIMKSINLDHETSGTRNRNEVKIQESTHPDIVLESQNLRRSAESSRFKHTIPNEDISIVWPLSPSLATLLQTDAKAEGAVLKNEQA